MPAAAEMCLHGCALVCGLEEMAHVPDTAGRCDFLEIADAWIDDFAPIGRRATGTAGGECLLVGPRPRRCGWRRVRVIRHWSGSPEASTMQAGQAGQAGQTAKEARAVRPPRGQGR